MVKLCCLGVSKRQGSVAIFRNSSFFLQTGREEDPLESSLLLPWLHQAGAVLGILAAAAAQHCLSHMEVALCSNLLRIRKGKLKKTQQTEMMSKCLEKESFLWGLNFL